MGYKLGLMKRDVSEGCQKPPWDKYGWNAH